MKPDHMSDEEFFKIMDGMEEVNREMVAKIEEAAPMCHFRKMDLDSVDLGDGYYENYWVCSHCGNIKECD